MKVFSILLIVALAVVLAFELVPKLIPASNSEDLASSARDNRVELVGPPEGLGAGTYTFVYTGESTAFNIREGELRATVTGARVITELSGLPEGSFIPGYDLFALTDVDGEYIYYSHSLSDRNTGFSDFAGEDGSFTDGVYMVLLDVTLENAGCSCRTVLDAERPGTFYDPYLFKANELFSLCVLGDSAAVISDDNDRRENRIGLCFYSGYGRGDPDAKDAELTPGGEDDVTNYKMSFKLEPGERAALTLGYIVSRRASDGVLPDPGDLFAASTGVNSISEGDVTPAVYLGLDRPDGMGDR